MPYKTKLITTTFGQDLSSLLESQMIILELHIWYAFEIKHNWRQKLINLIERLNWIIKKIFNTHII